MCTEAGTVLRAAAADFFFNCWYLEIPSDNRIRHKPRCVHYHPQVFRLETFYNFYVGSGSRTPDVFRKSRLAWRISLILSYNGRLIANLAAHVLQYILPFYPRWTHPLCNTQNKGVWQRSVKATYCICTPLDALFSTHLWSREGQLAFVISCKVQRSGTQWLRSCALLLCIIVLYSYNCSLAWRCGQYEVMIKTKVQSTDWATHKRWRGKLKATSLSSLWKYVTF
jgi:hypothetical protein